MAKVLTDSKIDEFIQCDNVLYSSITNSNLHHFTGDKTSKSCW